MSENNRKITIHSLSDFDGMRRAGRLAAEVLDMIGEHVKPNITTQELNDLCHEMIVGAGATPAPLNYRGFPRSICTSVNHVVCHGIPGDLKLKDGDIVNIDVTVIVDGWYGDSSRMYWAGKPPIKAQRLTQVTYEAMMLGIEQVKIGGHLGDVGRAIQAYAEKHGYSVVRDYCGHGIGRVFHAAPSVLHYDDGMPTPEIKEGMFFTIEPMINVGGYETILNKHDGWTVTTRDKSLSAQFEHTVGVSASGCEIFTASLRGMNCPPY